MVGDCVDNLLLKASVEIQVDPSIAMRQRFDSGFMKKIGKLTAHN